jgi:hypothetical protein
LTPCALTLYQYSVQVTPPSDPSLLLICFPYLCPDFTSQAALGKDELNESGDSRRLLLGPLPYTAIWTGFNGPCELQPLGSSASIDYDQTAGRFIFSHVTQSYNSNSSTLLCVAVSVDEDAAGQKKFTQRFNANEIKTV